MKIPGTLENMLLRARISVQESKNTGGRDKMVWQF